MSAVSPIHLQQNRVFIPVRIPCNIPGHLHGTFDLSRQTVERESRRLQLDLSDSFGGPLIFDDFTRGYKCRIIESIVRIWHDSKEFAGRDDMSRFEQLAQLSIALWDYQCRTEMFEGFAKQVRDEYFNHHYRSKRYSREWAFVSVVFAWEHEFGQTVMDVRELSEIPGSPQQNIPLGYVWPHPVDLSVLRDIISPEFYAAIQNEACQWIYDTYSDLAQDKSANKKTVRKLADRLHNYFSSCGYTISRPGVVPVHSGNSSSKPTSDFFQNRTVIDLYRCFLEFFEQGQRQPNDIPQSKRVRPGPVKLSRKKHTEKKDGTALNQLVEEWYNNTFRDLLVHDQAQYAGVMERFNHARQQTLLVYSGSNLIDDLSHELETAFNFPPHRAPYEVSGGSSSKIQELNGYGNRYGNGGNSTSQSRVLNGYDNGYGSGY